MKYEVVPATHEHIAPLAARMRQSDVDELWAAAAILPADAIRMSMDHAEMCNTWLIDGTPAAIGGISRQDEHAGIIWFLCTDMVDTHQRAFLVQSRFHFVKKRQGYDLLFNYVDARNERAIRWLLWLRFSFEGPYPHGVFRKPFYRFFWERNQ